MDSNRNHSMGMPDGTGEGTSHIWLRYATQFSVGDRSYTIDMGIPVPLGADDETREQLLHEANVGMDQLSQHVEWRVAQVQQNAGTTPAARTVPTQRSAAPSYGSAPPSSSSSAPIPSAPTRPASTPVSASRPASQSNTAAASPNPVVPAASAPTREMPTDQQPSQSRQSTQSAQSAQSVQPAQPAQTPQPTQKRSVTVPPTRPNIGASMPASPGLPSGTMQLPQFLQYIKEMGLDARQAMDLLKLKSLSGLNLRDALEQLQHIVMKEGVTAAMPTPASTAPPSTPAQGQTQRPKTDERGPGGPGSNSGSSKQAATNSTPASTGASSTPSNSTRPAPTSSAASMPTSSASATSMPSVPRTSGSAKGSAVSEPKPIVIQEERAPYRGFDEEEEEDDFDFSEEEEDDDDDAGAGGSIGLSAADRGSAEGIVSRLRTSGGSTAVSAGRLNVLHNVIDGQIEPEQLQALIRHVWSISLEKKLKGEQAEALISWGKQDDFVSEAEMVLAYFEEDANARSDR